MAELSTVLIRVVLGAIGFIVIVSSLQFYINILEDGLNGNYNEPTTRLRYLTAKKAMEQLVNNESVFHSLNYALQRYYRKKIDTYVGREHA